MMKTAIQHKLRRVRRFLRFDEGVSALEYALVVGIVATGLAAVLVVFEGELTDAITAIGKAVDNWNLTTGVDRLASAVTSRGIAHSAGFPMMKTAIKHKWRRVRRFLRSDEAVSALEYAFVVGIIATGTAVALATFENEITAALTAIGNAVDDWNLTTGASQ